MITVSGCSLTAKFGDKIAITGTNGSGKTTLLKILLGWLKAEGENWISPAANIGYLTLEVFDLSLEQTPEQFFYLHSAEDSDLYGWWVNAVLIPF